MAMVNAPNKLVRLTSGGVRFGAAKRGWSAVEMVAFRQPPGRGCENRFLCTVIFRVESKVDELEKKMNAGPPLERDEAEELSRRLTTFFRTLKTNVRCVPPPSTPPPPP